MSIANWIDKQLENINVSEEYVRYFSNIDLEIIEGNKYLFNPEKGIDIVLSKFNTIKSIHLFSGNTQKAKRFNGIIVNDITFEMSKTDVLNKLGKPGKSGGGYNDILGFVPSWDKYYFDFYSCHIQYSEDLQSIELITLGSMDLEPYLNSLQQ